MPTCVPLLPEADGANILHSQQHCRVGTLETMRDSIQGSTTSTQSMNYLVLVTTSKLEIHMSEPRHIAELYSNPSLVLDLPCIVRLDLPFNSNQESNGKTVALRSSYIVLHLKMDAGMSCIWIKCKNNQLRDELVEVLSRERPKTVTINYIPMTEIFDASLQKIETYKLEPVPSYNYANEMTILKWVKFKTHSDNTSFPPLEHERVEEMKSLAIENDFMEGTSVIARASETAIDGIVFEQYVGPQSESHGAPWYKGSVKSSSDLTIFLTREIAHDGTYGWVIGHCNSFDAGTTAMFGAPCEIQRETRSGEMCFPPVTGWHEFPWDTPHSGTIEPKLSSLRIEKYDAQSSLH